MPLILAMLGLLLTGHSAAAADTTYAEKAAALVQSYIDADRFSGAVLVALDGKPIFRQGFGLANREWGIANTPETKFRIGSITKTFTSVAILQLVERGKLGLDDPVSRHYAKAPAAWNNIKIRHLLSQQSGILSFSRTPEYEGWSKVHHTPEESIGLIRDAPLRFEPGTKYEYSNSNHAILGVVIEAITGQSYAVYLRENILGPLGMNDSGLDLNETVISRRASGYDRESGAWKNAEYVAMSIPYAAGSMYSTVDDLLKWDQALGTEALLKSGSLRAMFTDYDGGYGFGWRVGNWLGNRVHTNSGGISGFTALICRYPDERLTIILLTNLHRAPVAWIANELASLHLGIFGTLGHLCLYES